VNTAKVASEQQTVTSRLEARNPACKVRRALDGRAICAPNVALAKSADKPALKPIATPRVEHVDGLLPGEYLVIGSFNERQNAMNWASFNADFGTDVQPVPHLHSGMYRVVVGPLQSENTVPMREILAAVGAGNSWRLEVCGPTSVTPQCESITAAKLAHAVTH